MEDTHSVKSESGRHRREFQGGLVPFFTLLDTLEELWPTYMSLACMIITFMQPIAFVVNTRWAWGETVGTLSDAAYFFLLPFWDSEYTHPWGMHVSVAAFWVVVAALLIVAVIGAIFFKEGGDHLSGGRWIVLLKCILHSTATVFFIPFCCFLLTLMVCDEETETLWVVKDVDCWSTMHSVHLVVGCLAFVALILAALPVRALLFKQSPFSLQRWARAHSGLDMVALGYDVATPVLYFTLLSSRHHNLFAGLHCFNSVTMALLHCLIQPYYSQKTNVVKATGYLIAGALSAFVVKPSWELTHRGIDLVLIGAICFLSWFSCVWMVRRARAPQSYLQAMEAMDAGTNNTAKRGAIMERFPLGLPWRDLEFSPHKLLERHLVGQGPLVKDPLFFNVSTVHRVYLSTDIELACRFLRTYCFKKKLLPEKQQLGYYARIYTKGFCKYRGSALVHLHLIFFLHYYCHEHASALSELWLLQDPETSVSVTYSTFKLNNRLRTMLNIKDHGHHKTLLRAHRLHVEALSYMTLFWTKLMGESFDSLDLALLADTITETRAAGLRAFELAVTSRFDKTTGMRYAQFLEQVMLDEAGAQVVRGSLKETTDSRSGTSESVRLHLEATKKTATVRKTQASKTISTLNLKMNGMFFLFFLIVCGFVIFEVVMAGVKNSFIESMQAAGQVRNLAQYNAYVSLTLTQTAFEEKQLDNNCKNTLCTATGIAAAEFDCSIAQVFPRTTALKERLSTVTSEFRKTFNTITSGKYTTSYRPLIDLYKNPTNEVKIYLNRTANTMELAGMWEICNVFLHSLESLLETELSPAINRSLSLYGDQFLETLDIGVYVTVVLFAAALILVFLVYLMLEMSFLMIASAKMETLNLFSLIPKNTLQTIYADSKDRCAKYEKLDSDSDEESAGEEVVEMDDDDGDKNGGSGVSGAFKTFLKHGSKVDGKVIKHNLEETRDEDADDMKDMELKELQYLDGDDDETVPVQYIPSKEWPRRIGVLIRALAIIAGVASMVLVVVTESRFNSVRADSKNTRAITSHHHTLTMDALFKAEFASSYSMTCERETFARFENERIKHYATQSFTHLVPLTENASQIIRLKARLNKLEEMQFTRVSLAKHACDAKNITVPWQHAFVPPVTHVPQVDTLALHKEYVKAFGDAATEFREAMPEHQPDHDLPLFYTALMACLAVLSATMLAVRLHLTDEHMEHDGQAWLGTAILKVCSLLALAAFVLCILMKSEADEYVELSQHVLLTQRHGVEATLNLASMKHFLDSWMVTGNTLWLLKYEEIMKEQVTFYEPIDNLVRSVESSGLKLGVWADDGLSHWMSQLRRIETIAMILYASATNAPIPKKLDTYVWRRADDDTIPITTSEHDMNLSPAEKMALARAIVGSTQYTHVLEETEKSVRFIDKRLTESDTREMEDREYDLEKKGVIVKVFVAIIIAAQGIFVVYLLTSTLRDNIRSADGRTTKGKNPAVLYAKYTMKVKVSLLFVAAFLLAIFSLEVSNLFSSRDLVNRLNYASSREWFASKSVLAAQVYLHSDNEHDRLVNGRILEQSIHDAKHHADSLYFDDHESSGFAKALKQSTVVNSIFGSDNAVDHRISCKASPDGAGVDEMHRKFNRRLLGLRHDKTPTDNEDLRREIDVLLAELTRSTEEIAKKAKDEVSAQQFVTLVVLVLTAVLLIAESAFVFRPMASKLLQQEEGTKLMLKMIPEKERKTVGAIVQFLETGQMSNNKKLEEVNEVVTQISTTPTVVVDSYGTILLFSRAAQEVFLYKEKETVGQNVKMLMPEEYSQYHDLFLARYKKTGVKNIIGSSRNVTAVRKDGTIFPVNIAVKEYRQGRKSIYIGFITDISLDIETERVNQLNNEISRVGATPVICIDLKNGTMIRWNRAASETFGYTPKEALKHNVKMLMKPDLAEMHDSFLERYRRTGKSKYIGTGMKLAHQGVKKSGECFKVELVLEEVRLNETDTIIIGNVRDVTEECLLNRQVAIHEAIINQSPVPLVVINIQGIIQKFSPAAERELGWKASDIIGQNVNVIQGDEVAARHNQILATYAKTGVKHVIGTTREAEVKRKDGSLYTATLCILDAVPADPKFPTLFIGYLVNKSDEKWQHDVMHLAQITIDLCPVPLIVIQTDGTIDVFSESSQQFTGYSKEDVVGENVKLLQTPEIAKEHDMYLSRYLETGVAHVIGTTRVLDLVRKDGTIASVSLCVKEVKCKYGHRYFSYLTDMNTKVETERMNELGSATIELCPMPLICITAVGQIRLFSKAACTFFGWESDDIMYKNIKVIMDEETAALHDGYLAAYRRTGVQHVLGKVIPVTAVRKDMSRFPAELKVSEFKQQGASYFVGFMTDITEKKALMHCHMATQAVLQGSAGAVISISQTGIIQLVSPQGYEIFGYDIDSKEMLGKNVKMLIPDQLAEHHDGFLKKYLKTGIKNVIGRDFNANAKKKDGKEFPCDIAIREKLCQTRNGDKHRVFVGYIFDNSDKYIVQQNSKLNSAAQTLVTFPLIVITITGKILSFNQPACDDFGYTEDETVGANIKMCMPDEVAEQHDGYLLRYRKTGVKHIIDSSRVVTAKRKDGSTFTAEVFVKEVKRGGQTSYFGNLRDVTEVQEIEFRREVIESVVAQASCPILSMNGIGTIRIFNKACEQLFGWHARDVEGKNIKMLQPPEVAEMHDEYLLRYAKTGIRTVLGTTRVVTAKKRNGKKVDVALSVEEIKCGDRVTFVAFVKDETEERAMMRTEVSGHALMEAMLTPCIRINHVGHIMQVSLSVSRTFGWTEEELLASNIKALQPDEVARNHDQYLSNYLRTRTKKVIDSARNVQAKQKDGTLFNANISVREIDTGNPAEPFFVGYVRDLRQEEAIAKSSQQLREIARMNPDTVLQIDSTGIIKSSNQACTNLLGYGPDELVGQNIKMIQPPYIAEKHDEYLAVYRETGEKHIINKVQLLEAMTKDGSLIPVYVTVRELTIEGLGLLLVGTLVDARQELAMQRMDQTREVSLGGFPYPCVVIDPQGMIQVVSNNFKTLFQCDAPVGQNIKLFMPPDIADNHDGYLAKYAQTGKTKVMNKLTKLTAYTTKGERIPIESWITQVTLGGKKAYVGYLRDLVDERTAAQEAALAEMMAAKSPVGSIIIDPMGSVMKVNEEALRMTGRSREDLMGCNVNAIMPEPYHSEHDGYLKRYRDTGVAHVIGKGEKRVTLLSATGSHTPVSLRICKIGLHMAEPVFLATLTDITDMVSTEFLSQYNASVEMLCTEAIITVDLKDNTVSRFNTTAENLFGFQSSEVMGQNVKMLMPDETAVKHDSFLEAYKSKREPGYKVERTSVGKRKDGSTFGIRLTIAEVAVGTGQDQQIFLNGFIQEQAS